MKKIGLFVLVLITAMSLGSCDWFRGLVGMPTSAELREKEEKVRQDSIAREQLRWRQEQIRLIQDSLLRVEAQKQPEVTPRYHVVFGSFMVQGNAKRMTERLTKDGYNPMELHFKNGYSVISAASYHTLREAYNAMNDLVRSVPFAPYDIWVYDLRQNLHQ